MRFTVLTLLTVFVLSGCVGGSDKKKSAPPVVDSNPPALSLNGSNPIELKQGSSYVEPGASATDDIDGDISHRVIISSVDTQVLGTHIVTYDVADSTGNRANQITRTVIIRENLLPQITLIGDQTIELLPGEIYLDPGATAYDTIDGDISNRIVVTGGDFDSNISGQYTVSYNVKTEAGEVAEEVSRTVIVNQLPVLKGRRTVLNDTGIDWGGNSPNGNNVTCTGEIVTYQDCFNGRDNEAAQGNLNKSGNGMVGFDFTKLDEAGNALLIQTGVYSEAGSSELGTKWSCVRDNHTGLIWEIKTDTLQSENLHSKLDRFDWFNSSPVSNGGDPGSDNANGNTCFGYAAAESTSFCNTQAFIDRVNQVGLCGKSDWRLPSLLELQSIAHLGLTTSPAIDTNYFPNTQSSLYWSDTPHANSSFDAWGVGFLAGNTEDSHRNGNNFIRLVRSNDD